MRVLIYGAGGHGKIVCDAIESGNKTIKVVGFIDDKIPVGTEILPPNKKVIGNSLNLDEVIEKEKIEGFFIAIGNNQVRKNVYEKLRTKNLEPVRAIHTTAEISPYAKIERGVLINAGAIINVNAYIGENSIINTGVIIEHDNYVGPHSHIGPGAVLGGTVKIGELTFIGMNATVENNLSIGKNCMVGMGSVVTKDIPDNQIVYGVPARVKGTNPEYFK